MGYVWFKVSLRVFLLTLTSFFPSFLRVLSLRALGANIGKGTKIYPFALLVAETIEIGNDSLILPFSVILNLKKLVLGNRCFVHWGAMITGHGQGSLFMDHFSYIGLGSVVNCTEDVHIGAYTCVGPKTVIYTHGSYLSTFHGYPNRFGAVHIGKSSWLNVGAIVLPGVSIGDNTIVKAGCVVSRDLANDRVLELNAERSYTERSIREVKRDRTEEFVASWYDSLFDQLESHLHGPRDALRMERLGPRVWRIAIRTSVVEVIHLPAPDEIPEGLERGKTLLLLDKFDSRQKRRLARFNWIDFEANELNLVGRSDAIRTLLGYFELRKGIHLTRAELTPAQVRTREPT